MGFVWAPELPEQKGNSYYTFLLRLLLLQSKLQVGLANTSISIFNVLRFNASGCAAMLQYSSYLRLS